MAANAGNSGGDVQEGGTISTVTYDGLGRRVKKAITNSADWDMTYNYYYDGHALRSLGASMINRKLYADLFRSIIADG